MCFSYVSHQGAICNEEAWTPERSRKDGDWTAV